MTFMGALPAGGRYLRILRRAGRSVSVPLTADESYWVTVDDPIIMFWTQADGITRTSRLFNPHGGPGGFSAYFG